MVYYVVDCRYDDRYAKAIFYKVYKRRTYADKAFEKYKPIALGNNNIRLTLYTVDTDTSGPDEFGRYELEWIEKI